MRICVVVNNMNDFGGLEEFAKNLAVGVQQQGHTVSVLSTVWIQPENQYVRALREHNIPVVQLPGWLSLIVSDWTTKERLLAGTMKLSGPLVYVLASLLYVKRKGSWRGSLSSAHNWLRGQWQTRVIGPDRRRPLVSALLSWWRLSWRPDLIHIHGYTSNPVFVIDWAHARGLPVVYEEHQTPDAQFDWWGSFSKSINKASLVVAVSEKSAQGLREVCGVTQPIAVAYYMVPDPAAWGWSAEANRDAGGSSIRLTTLARLYVTKGLTYLLDAIALVRAVHPNAQFKVYGDGPLRDELLVYAQKLGLDGEEIFAGAFTRREELDGIMAQTDIYVMSSILEGLPISLLEAMSYGRAIVTTPAGGSAEAVEDGVSALLCRLRDPECLAEQICALIEDPARRASLGWAARNAYEEGPFTPAAVAQRYISLYQEVLAQPRQAPELAAAY